VRAGLGVLLLCTPLAFGTVHLWAFSLMEAAMFFLALVWMTKLLILAWQKPRSGQCVSVFMARGMDSVMWPLWLFVGFGALQLVPLPPALLSQLSPATYTLYAQSLPGWPQQMPYADRVTEEKSEITVSEVKYPTAVQVSALMPTSTTVDTRLPLSVAPTLTYSTLLKLLAYATLFSLIVWYPISAGEVGDHARRFWLFLLIVVVVSGLLVATIGIVQRYAWNGKILWFFVPQGWEGARPGIVPRASGSFVNSDHFANYLVLIWPLALGGWWRAESLVSAKWLRCWRIVCTTTLLVIGIGVLLSLSRAGWIGIAGGSVVCWFLLSRFPEPGPHLSQRMHVTRRWLMPLGGILLFLLAFVTIGEEARTQINRRIEKTVGEQSGLHERLAVWHDSTRIAADFPLVGVGLGAWSEVFPRYQRPPWNPVPWREAHNEYVQGFAETGVIGTGLLSWFFAGVGMRLLRGLRTLTSLNAPPVIGIVAALIVMAFHAGFDFVLQIPANALLLTVLLAIGLQLTEAGTQQEPDSQLPCFRIPLIALGGITAVILCVLSITQTSPTGIRDIEEIVSVSEAQATILSFPTRAVGHRALFVLQKEQVPLAQRIKELEIALWLEPLNPEARDEYAVALIENGDPAASVREIQQSIFSAPVLEQHFYLTAKAIPSLEPQELQAIEQGFRRAVTAQHRGAVEGLAGFYQLLGRVDEQAAVYAEAARTESRRDWRVRYLREAGVAYARTGRHEKAEWLLRRVIQLTPRDPLPYRVLVTEVFATKGDLATARQLIASGIAKGSDATSLLISLADAAQQVGDWEQAKTTLQSVITRQASSFDAHLRLGKLYLREKNYAEAAVTLRRATALRPDSAPALALLKQAEEGHAHLSEGQSHAFSGEKRRAKHEEKLRP
jgi:Flp pilus assembly protein TadD